MNFETIQPNTQKETEGKEKPLELISRKKSAELTAALEDIDHGTIKDLFVQEMRKSNGDSAEINYIEAENIEESDSINFYDGKLNYIGLNYSDAKEVGQRLGYDQSAQLLSTLIHEEAHAISKNTHDFNIDDDRLEVRSTSGYTKSLEKISGAYGEHYEIIKAAEALNEGVTDLIARELTLEYYRRKGKLSQTLKGQLEELGELRYRIEKIFVSALVRKIAKECSVPADVVWGSIKQGYFSGLNVLDEENIDLFDEILGENFSLSFFVESDDELIHDMIRHLREFVDDEWSEGQKAASKRLLRKLAA